MPSEHRHNPLIRRILILVLLIAGAAVSAAPAPLGIPPVAVPDVLTTSEDELLFHALTANDIDPDGWGVYAALPETKLSALGARVIIYEHGTLLYDPEWGMGPLQALNVGDILTDTFTYTAQDNDGLTAQGLVTVTVTGANDLPWPQGPIVPSSICEGQTRRWHFPLDVFADIDDEPVFTFEATLTDGSPLPEWIQFMPQSGVFAAQPPLGSAGSYALRVHATDAHGGTGHADAQLVVVPRYWVPFVLR